MIEFIVVCSGSIRSCTPSKRQRCMIHNHKKLNERSLHLSFFGLYTIEILSIKVYHILRNTCAPPDYEIDGEIDGSEDN